VGGEGTVVWGGRRKRSLVGESAGDGKICDLAKINFSPNLQKQTRNFVFGFWFLVWNAATQLALQLHQDRIQVVEKK
jgi:hypothetical protein